MYSFVAIVNAGSSATADRRLRVGASVLEHVMPAHGVALRTEVATFGDSGLGWAYVAPHKPASEPRIQVLTRGDRSVLVHGRVSLPVAARGAAIQTAAAEAVLNAFEHGGIAAVRRLDGSFCALIVDQRTKTALWCTDLVGHMSPRWIQRDGALYLASHDVGLVGVSGCDVAIDPVSALSITLFDWSLRGAPLLRGAEVASPECWYEAAPSGLRTHSEPILVRSKQHAETTTEPRALDHMLEQLVAETASVCSSAERVIVSLTGGMDSRLLLALVLAARPTGQLQAVTSGTPWSIDVATAQALSAIVGIPHERVATEPPELNDFRRRAETYAFHFNGDTSAKRALSGRVPDRDEARLTGGAGEIFRGYYYGLSRGEAASAAPEIADRLWSKTERGRKVVTSSAQDGLSEAVQARLRDTFSSYESVSSSAHDLLDYFYLFERYARWGALVSRRVWWNAFSPLACSSAIQSAWALPGPIGNHCPIHRLGAKRHLPMAAYVMPINGASLFATEGTLLAQPLARAGSMMDQVLQRVDARFAATQSVRSVFSRDLYPFTESLCTRADGVTAQVFGSSGLTEVLSAHQRNGALLESVSCLVTMELWLDQLRRAKELTRNS